ncbi:MAG: zf-HC2 domain-containing protein [Actinobacteria bacterium]|nr:zf-HC2 domain-containing protein [Actinomycetota bacterium]
MSRATCDGVRGQVPDFALGTLTGRERAEMIEHLDGCPACQALVGEYTSVADALLDLIPEAEPGADIGTAVFAAMRTPARARRRHRVVALVAAAIIVIGATAGIGIALVPRDSGGHGVASAPTLRSSPMVGSGDITVGRIVTSARAPRAITVSINYWLTDGSYALAARNRAGEASLVGQLQIKQGRGSWTGNIPERSHPVAVMLVDKLGNVTCEGQLP